MDNIRWKQRFQNFEKAYNKLNLAINAYNSDPSNELIQMALIQAFEFTYELGWNTMKDFLKYEGIDANYPRDVIKQAFATNIIDDGQAWIEMMQDRNLMSHIYDEAMAKLAIDHILNKYTGPIEQVYKYFKERL